MPRPRRPASSCQDCLSWGDHFYTDLCDPCYAWRRKFGSPTECRCCSRVLACKDSYCRLCRKQASLNHDSRIKVRINLDTPAHTGHQLFLADLFRSVKRSAPRCAPASAPLTVVQKPLVLRPQAEQLALLHLERDVSRVPMNGLQVVDPQFTEFVLARAEELADARGWSPLVREATRRGLVILTGVHGPFEPIPASVVQQLARRKIPVKRVTDVLTDLGLLHDNRPDLLTQWIDTQLDGLPQAIRGEVLAWIKQMREGTPRSRPRARQTVVNKLRRVSPFLQQVGSRYDTLRQVLPEDCKTWLDNQTGDRQLARVAIRSLFRTLKSQRLVFADPTRSLRGGMPPKKAPKPLAPHKLAAATDKASANPALRVMLALAAVHALNAQEIRTLKLDDIDLPGKRITLRAASRPLDPYTFDALAHYINMRRSRWPRSANPHLLLSPITAHADGPVSHGFIAKTLDKVGLTITQLKTDRYLDEAMATNGDPILLAQIFGLSHTRSCHYADAVRAHQEAEARSLETD